MLRIVGVSSLKHFYLLFIRGFFFFFFQAEDGIRDIGVTGVQTCALPISSHGTKGARPGSCVAAGSSRDATSTYPGPPTTQGSPPAVASVSEGATPARTSR